MIASLFGFIASLVGAVISLFRNKDKQQEAMENAVKAQRNEAKNLASPAKPWRDTVDEL